jgi:hypothetical protein
MDWSTFLRIGHIVGTALGAGAATLVEFQLFAAKRNGSVSRSEGQLLSVTYWIIRIGLILIIFSGFGFFLNYRLTDRSTLLFEPRFWAKITITGILVVNAFMMHVRKVPLWIGAAISITAWYAAIILGAWRRLDAGYLMIMTMFCVVLLPVMWLMRYLHDRPITPPKQ